MSDPEFTPGPWAVTVLAVGLGAAIVTDGHIPCRWVATAKIIGHAGETEANRHLLAAAPDLYFACVLADEYLVWHGVLLGESEPESGFHQIRALLAGALKKARGEVSP